jgi:stringent starvation protein B
MKLGRSIRSWFKSASSAPWSEHDVIDGKIANLAYNKAFVQELRESFREELISTYRTDAEVAAMWVARRNYEAEDPIMEVEHSSIGADGKLNLKLKWNDAFIRMLRSHGFGGETEDIIVQAYLASIARDNADGVPLPVEEDGTTSVKKALDSLDEETARELEREIRKRAQLRSKNSQLRTQVRKQKRAAP